MEPDFLWVFRTYLITYLVAFLFSCLFSLFNTSWKETKWIILKQSIIRGSSCQTYKLPFTNRITPLKSKFVFLNKQNMVALFYMGNSMILSVCA